MSQDAHTSVQLIDAYLLERLHDVQIVSNLSALQHYVQGDYSPNSKQQALNALSVGQQNDVNYDSWSVLDMEGNKLLWYPIPPQTHGNTLIPPDTLDHILQSTNTLDQLNQSTNALFSGVYYEPAIGNASVVIYMPIIAPGSKVAGILRVEFLLNYIWNVAGSQVDNVGSYAFVLDQNGVRIAYANTYGSTLAHSKYLFTAITPLTPSQQHLIASQDLYGNNEQRLTTFNDALLATRQNDSHTSSKFEMVPAGQQENFEVVKVPISIMSLSWTYYALRPLKAIVSVADQQLHTTLLIGAIVLILAIIIGVITGRRITQPILRSMEIAMRELKMRKSLLEIAVCELEMRKSLRDIAGAVQRLDEIFPQDIGLIDPQWIMPLVRLRDASQEAQKSLSLLGRQARYEALEEMKESLRKVHPDVSLSDQQLNHRLGNVVAKWLAVAEQEQERLKQAQQDRGYIDNPYKPGQILKLSDTTFVGRRDLAQQLQAALSRENSRPTFLLYGERRMGKSSTLLHLPKLLGSRYLPVFCDLQKTGVAANIAIFLGTLAEEIQRVMTAKGIRVKPLNYEMLRTALKQNEAEVYHEFNGWLDQIEQLLEQEDRTLLLTLDEFEQLEDTQRTGNLQLPALLNWFRNIIQYRSRLALLFSGVHTLEEMETSTGTNWSGYFVNVRTLHVGFLHREEARQLIAYAGEEIVSEEVVETIITETGCHPFLVQAVCSTLIDRLNAEQRERAEIGDVWRAVEQVLEDWRSYFRDLWNRTDEQQRACLHILSVSGKADVSQFEQDGIDGRTVQRTLHVLMRRDLVGRDSNGFYCITTPLFCEWVKRSIDS